MELRVGGCTQNTHTWTRTVHYYTTASPLVHPDSLQTSLTLVLIYIKHTRQVTFLAFCKKHDPCAFGVFWQIYKACTISVPELQTLNRSLTAYVLNLYVKTLLYNPVSPSVKNGQYVNMTKAIHKQYDLNMCCTFGMFEPKPGYSFEMDKDTFLFLFSYEMHIQTLCVCLFRTKKKSMCALSQMCHLDMPSIILQVNNTYSSFV